MNLIKDNWTDKDIENFREFEKTKIGLNNDCEWEQRIVNTKLQCFAKTSYKAKEIVKEIKKGNYFDFIEKLEIKNHLDSLVCAFLINSIKNNEQFEKYLKKYVETIDNWASCDTLSFKKRENNFLFELSKNFLKSKKPFVKRVGLNIYFELIKTEAYLDKCFEILDYLADEKEYYVNMCAAWLLSYCFVVNKEKTLNYFKNNKTNNFIINKAISKCRDSYRVSLEDKEKLLKYKKTN